MIENTMFHHHLVAAYSFTWLLQLGYLGYVISKHVIANRYSKSKLMAWPRDLRARHSQISSTPSHGIDHRM